MNTNILENERIDDLQLKGLKVIQKKDGFCFGVDAVLLANFAEVKNGANVVDLGTGTGIIPILLAGKTNAKFIHGIEIQKDMAEMAARSVMLNELESKVKIHEMDLKKSVDFFGKSQFDLVVTNPPYMNKGAGLVNPTDYKAISRHELLCNLEDIISVSSQLLNHYGTLNMVHRPHRLVDILTLMRQYRIEPKYLRFVYPKPNKEPNMVLIKGIKYGNPELKMMKPLYVYDESGNYSKEIDLIYNRGVF